MANETRYALPCVHHPLERYPHSEDRLNFAFQREPVVLAAAERQAKPASERGSTRELYGQILLTLEVKWTTYPVIHRVDPSI
ncbi:hypothetical protein AL478_028045 [Klebsiella pneumoniae]|nr:hypothetical protein AL478_028045 [Klebsiella pneumoniae]